CAVSARAGLHVFLPTQRFLLARRLEYSGRRFTFYSHNGELSGFGENRKVARALRGDCYRSAARKQIGRLADALVRSLFGGAKERRRRDPLGDSAGAPTRE